jgi:alkanesulfonate monooxygenase SsuD/methylene tetrahydromethanopterin reductase-like flavin-dependent oxidoreductase (luciferase family)
MATHQPIRFVLTTHVEEHANRPAATTYAEVFEQTELADSFGFDALWLAEHHFGAQDGRAPQPLLVALAAAHRTRRINVGTSLIVLPLHHPVEVAEQLATLDVLTGGRLSIGFGSGSAPFEFAGFDAPFDAPRRHGRFREALEVLERAWSGEPFSHEGPQFQIGEIRLVPRPTRPLREFSWIGAMSEQTAATAGEVGYGLQLPRGHGPEHYAGVLAAYRNAFRASQGPDTRERVAIARCIYVGADDESAVAEAGSSITRFYLRGKGVDKTAPPPPVPDLIANLHFIVGGPEKCAREIAAFAAATGLTHLSVQPNWEGLSHANAMASLRRLGEDVMPRVAKLMATRACLTNPGWPR